MLENQTVENTLTVPQKLLSMLLGCGVILAATHGAFFSDSYSSMTPVDFNGKVTKDLHTHTDFSLHKGHIWVDPRSLRHIRSEGDKTAESDSLRGNWDFYRA